MKLKKLFLFCVALAFVLPSFGQSVPKSFKVRTSQYSPTRKIYNLPGDFALIGNTNMILNPYSETMGNNNTAVPGCDISPMVYVDIDGDPTTVNSSSAQLVYSTENGCNVANTEVVYAGLYWMSRAEPTLYTDGDTIDHAYKLTVSKTSSKATFTLNPLPGTGAHKYTIVYKYGAYNSGHSTSGSTVTMQQDAGTAEDIMAIGGNDVQYNLVTTSGSVIDGRVALDADIDDGIGHPLWVRFANRQGGIYIAKRTQKELSVVKNGKSHSLYENKIKFKHQSEANYTTITAANTEIMYPNHQDHSWNGQYFLNVSYAEVTDYVRAHGAGNYFGADICIKEGHDFQVGYTGGWGLVVVYQNEDMTWRDITIFDGYAIMNGPEAMNVNINGFRAVQTGDVNVKVAMMAAEGENGLKGDICEIRKGNTSTYEPLHHSHNSTDDFFNGSIVTTGSRNPNYSNNCGLDLVVFNLDNTGNSLINNGQTNTRLRYLYQSVGGTQDVYVPFFFAIALDSYNSNPEIADNNLDVVLTANCVEAVPDFTSDVLAIATTDCPLSTTHLVATQSPAAGTPVARGTSVTVTVTVTDDCGKTAQKEINVSAPQAEIICPPDVNKLLAFGDCVMTIYPSEIGTPTHSLGSDWITSITSDKPTDNIYPEGDNVITWTITDKCGNVLTCKQHVIVVFPVCPDAVDCEGNVYHGVRIDCDCWTQRNLESNCYGDPNDCASGSCADPIPCVYEYETAQNPDVAANVATFGKLYCDTAALGDSTVNAYGHVRGICPKGWYLPTPEKYEQLNSHGADALKSPLYWTDGGGSNTTDFTWLPAGWYNGELGRFEGMLSEGYFWSTKVVSGKVQSSAVEIFHDCDSVIQKESHSGLGYSVRCIKEKD